MPDYHRPSTIDDAVGWLGAARAAGRAPVIAAGCTDLFPATERKTLPGDILDLTGIDGLRGISFDGGHWRFGATTTWTEVLRADLPPAFDGLKAAAREVGSVQIQNAATVAGNLCNASPAADGTPCWLTLGAEVELRSASGIRHVPVERFVTGPRRTLLAEGEIVTALRVPVAAGAGQGAFRKLGARRYLVISIAMVAARIECGDGLIMSARIAVGACSPVPVRQTSLEAALTGCPVRDAASRLDPGLVTPWLTPLSDVRADAAYRLEAATELVARTVCDCLPEVTP